VKELKSFIGQTIVCQDMLVWKPGKLQSYKIEDLVFDVELFLTMHLH
jgi:hypothetical protein